MKSGPFSPTVLHAAELIIPRIEGSKGQLSRLSLASPSPVTRKLSLRNKQADLLRMYWGKWRQGQKKTGEERMRRCTEDKHAELCLNYVAREREKKCSHLCQGFVILRR